LKLPSCIFTTKVFIRLCVVNIENPIMPLLHTFVKKSIVFLVAGKTVKLSKKRFAIAGEENRLIVEVP